MKESGWNEAEAEVREAKGKIEELREATSFEAAELRRRISTLEVELEVALRDRDALAAESADRQEKASAEAAELRSGISELAAELERVKEERDFLAEENRTIAEVRLNLFLLIICSF